MLPHWLRQLSRRPLLTATRASRPSRPRPRARLGVELLEGRLTPSTTTTLAVSPNPVLEGGHLTTSALVVDGLGTPVAVGQVTFSLEGGGSTVRLEGRSGVSAGFTLQAGGGLVCKR